MEKTHTEERHSLTTVYESCPDRSYIELTVPRDVESVLWVEFHATTHDQGFADDRRDDWTPSWTFMYSTVRRPYGRNDLRPFEELRNHGADSNFFSHTKRWHVRSCSEQRRLWMESLEPGDIIQLTPKAFFQGWVNFVKCARISIGYLPKQETLSDGVNGEPRSAEEMALHLNLQPLDSSRKEIRLLVVNPGLPGDQLLCDLISLSLLDEPQFDAMSYCWQGTGGQSVMHIRNRIASSEMTHHHPQKVSSNVTDALQNLRHEHESKIIWIDQLCINQRDDNERASQVSMMADIYSQASQVHIWLGNGTVETDFALSLVRDVYNHQFGSCAGGKACECNGTAHHLLPQDITDIIDRDNVSKDNPLEVLRCVYKYQFDKWDQGGRLQLIPNEFGVPELMASLLSRPWFLRVWVLQEALGAQCAWVHCGEYSAPWEELLAVSDWVGDKEAFHPPIQVTMPSIWFNSALENRNIRSESASCLEETRQPFLDVFLHGLSMRASDPRDRIFALLSFGSDTSTSQSLSPLIQPSYTKSVSEVFADFTRWWIITYKSLSILSAITRSQRGRTWQRLRDDLSPCLPDHSTLPTSLPTWALGIDGQRNSDDPWTLDPHFSDKFGFMASGLSSPDQGLLNANIASRSDILGLHGFKVTDIEIISHLLFDTPFDSSLEELLSVYLGLLDPAGYQKLTRRGYVPGIKTKYTPQSFSDVWPIWRLRYGGHCGAHWNPARHEPPPEGLEAYILESLSSENGDFVVCRTHAIPNCVDPSLFISSNRMVGLCPRPAKEGDVVVVLHGGKVPYLLRPIRNNGDAAASSPGIPSEQYEFIGECYVKGIMRGEYFEEQVKSGRQPDVFTIL